MKTLYIDADACPVKDEAIAVAERRGLAVVLVSNRGFRTTRPFVRSVLVDAGPDAADKWIAAAIAPGDVCVTNDVPLAARCVEAGARAISPSGKVFDDASVGIALAMRDLMTDLRASGEITSGPRSFTPRDRSRFRDALDALVR